jgi:hypothetical protein
MSSFSIKEKLFGLHQSWQKSQISQKGKRNALLKAFGLEWTFAPNVVLERIIDTNDGPKVQYSDRKGRILAECKPSRKALESGHKMRFTSPWLAGRILPLKRRTGKLSYILDFVSRFGLLREAIRPLTRLAAQFLKLSNKDFKGLVSSVCAVYSSKYKLGRNQRHSFASFGKPTLLSGEKSLSLDRARAPKWCWTEKYSAGSCCKTWRAN